METINVTKWDRVKVVYKLNTDYEYKTQRMKVLAVSDRIYVAHNNHFHSFDLTGNDTHMYIDEVKSPNFWQRLFS